MKVMKKMIILLKKLKLKINYFIFCLLNKKKIIFINKYR